MVQFVGRASGGPLVAQVIEASGNMCGHGALLRATIGGCGFILQPDNLNGTTESASMQLITRKAELVEACDSVTVGVSRLKPENKSPSHVYCAAIWC